MTGPFTLGQILGNVPIPSLAAREVAALASQYFDSAESNEFCGDPVEVLDVPAWAPTLASWWPEDALKGLGYVMRVTEPGDMRRIQDLVVTVGVDAHVDDMHGPVLCYVLHNDGLTFKQGRAASRPKAGDWFIFNDRAPHGVREAKGRAVFIGWTVPLEAV